MADDFELIDAWAGGDATAARELLKRYTPPLYRFFEHKLDGPIEDMVQDVLLACLESRGRARREAGFRAYAHEIAAILGIGERAVRSRLRRAKDELRDAVKKVAESPELLHSTWADFEAWAAALPKLDDEAGPGREAASPGDA